MKFKKKSRFSFLGLDLGSLIRYFFAGNASFAILILGLICFFLLKEAIKFFPDYNKELKIYKKSGLEYFDIIENEFSKFKKVSNNIEKIYFAELNNSLESFDKEFFALRAFYFMVKKNLKKNLDILKNIQKIQNDEKTTINQRNKLEELERKINLKIISEHRNYVKSFSKNSLPEFKNIENKLFKKFQRELLEFDVLNSEQPNILNFYEKQRRKLINKESQKITYLKTLSLDLKNSGEMMNKYWGEIRNKVIKTRNEAVTAENSSKIISGVLKRLLQTLKTSGDINTNLNAILENKYVKIEAKIVLLKFIQKQIPDFLDKNDKEKYINNLRKSLKNFLKNNTINLKLQNEIVNSNINSVVYSENFFNAITRVNKSSNEEELKKLINILRSFRVKNTKFFNQYINKFSKKVEKQLVHFIISYDYKTNYNFIKSKIDEHNQITTNMIKSLESVSYNLRDIKLISRDGLKFLKLYNVQAKDTVKLLNKTKLNVEKWNYRDEIGITRTIFSFFIGKKWITNSFIQDKYGILPLFSGSLIISLIAISIAIPISIFAAIYLNQIASTRELNIIKPTIEFIGAIPSIVLGFIGIVVLGEFLKTISDFYWLSWIPGFPIHERLNMLNAGLLLAFMAVPTIFSLAEDALNNVPSYYREASLALGASRIQTAIKVILPGASSGILAACLLGFGRIIGETMVVLLVAGNRISIPNFSDGLGVITQPNHTMTGIIAQELGEVVQGSIHYRALFMIGMVLFIISLIINFLAQKIINKYGYKL